MGVDLVLVVEDTDEDIEAIGRAIGRSHPDTRLEFLRSGPQVLPRLRRRPLPQVVLLDLNMPGEGGLDVIKQVRAVPGLAGVRLVVFTSSESQAEAEACYAAGADSYVYKPINFALFRSVLSRTLDYWENVTQTVVPPPGDSVAQA
ncbi:response regulator [Actinoplanes solisilvae]|uniref:response regulator n=1 Tax=Actinoplanes solisilvae TaxID=2486853 RepID=UPI000FD965EB|nr:response regulator [Actinoplanes solisilvae]